MFELERIQKVVHNYEGKLSDSVWKYLQRIYGKPVDQYRDRLIQYGFRNLGHVLDAGCGFGQWMLPLTEMNQRVTAFDVQKERVDFVQDLIREFKLSNAEVSQQKIRSLTYADATFDGIFCYLVLSLTCWKETLVELKRVLKPGGKLYVNAYGLGWFKHMWMTEHNRGPGYDPKLSVAKAFMNTWKYERGEGGEDGVDFIIEPAQLEAELKKLGFRTVEIAHEGCYGARDLAAAQAKSFFQGDFRGDAGVFEAVATL